MILWPSRLSISAIVSYYVGYFNPFSPFVKTRSSERNSLSPCAYSMWNFRETLEAGYINHSILVKYINSGKSLCFKSSWVNISHSTLVFLYFNNCARWIFSVLVRYWSDWVNGMNEVTIDRKYEYLLDSNSGGTKIVRVFYASRKLRKSIFANDDRRTRKTWN
jgi:hypothetical protein